MQTQRFHEFLHVADNTKFLWHNEVKGNGHIVVVGVMKRQLEGHREEEDGTRWLYIEQVVSKSAFF